MTATQTDLQQVLELTECAYMHDAYGTSWTACARFLLAQGHSVEEAAALMLSKHMRWADDSQGRGNGNRTNSAAFKRYYERSRLNWDDEAKQMARETF